MRDIEKYAKKYTIQSFEEYKVFYRRKTILKQIQDHVPHSILEIGCGREPLFQYVQDVKFTVVEPARDFYDNALALSKGNGKVVCLQGFFEDIVEKLSSEYDMIICSSLLHEVERPDKLLKSIAQVCSKSTIVHINVPNANSMHRLLGKEMGLLQDVHNMSKNNIDFQQNCVFDRRSLRNIVEGNGFEVIKEGSFFVKPFSHEQMYQMLEKGILDDAVMDGLYELGKYMPELNSEIYVNCRIKR